MNVLLKLKKIDQDTLIDNINIINELKLLSSDGETVFVLAVNIVVFPV